MTPNERDRLLMRYLDGSATPQEVDALSALLKTDADARATLREVAMQALGMADLAREQALSAPRQESKPQHAVVRHWRHAALASAAALIVVAGAVAVWLAYGQAEVVTLAQVSGAVTWNAEASPSRSGLEAGAELRAGTLSVEGTASSAQLRFRDGSVVTLAGDTELAFSGGGQKRFALQCGAITAEVQSQPAGRPMVVQTPTAEVEVVGTRFSLMILQGQTALAVESGRVRLRRLADRSEVEVQGGQVAVASLDAAEKLEAQLLPPAPPAWRQTFDQPPPATWRGEWRPADATGPGRLRNVPDVSYRRDDGTPVAAYIVCVHDNSGSVASVWHDSVLRIRLRTATKQNVLALVGLHNAVGGFAGNFQTLIKPDVGRPDASGWRTIELPLASLEPRLTDSRHPPPGGRVFLVYLACYSPKAGLEVAEVAIESPSLPR